MAGEWALPSATVRVEVRVDSGPTHPELGVLVKIPDGGLLPGPIPVPTVMDGSGAILPSVIVGFNRNDGLGVLFEEPKSGRATVYLTGAAKASPPDCKLIPSVLMFARNGKASLEDAVRMGKQYPPAADAYFERWPCIGSMVNPFGPDDNFVSWYVGAIALEKDEDIYFATISDEGSEVFIDGRSVVSWPGAHTRAKGAKGQMGKKLHLPAGVHRIDYYHFELKGAQEAQLVWKRKGMVTKDDLPELVTGFATSGTADILSIETKDGKFGGVIEGLFKPQGYVWIGDKPLNLFNLSYSGVGDPNAKVRFDFGNGQRFEGDSVTWIADGEPDQLSTPVALEVSGSKGTTRSVQRMYCQWTPDKMSLENDGDCKQFKLALLNKINSVARPADPCLKWGADYWQLLFELIEPYQSGPLLKELVERCGDSLAKRPNTERWTLEERWIEIMRLSRNDQQLLEWIGRFEKNEKNMARKFHWRDERICAYLLDLNQPESAKEEVKALKDAASTPDQAQIAALRLGDVERALGNTDAAMVAYKDAQERYRSRNKVGMAGGRMSYVGTRRTTKLQDTSGTNNAARAKSQLRSLRQPKTLNAKVDDWKIYTVHDASMYTTITSYLLQHALPEALQKLNDWENETPTSKLSGDFPMAEAKVYMYARDFRRAANALDIYRKNTSMSAQLADAMKLEIDALAELGDKKRIKEVAQDFVKKFPGHPYEKEMKELAK